MQLAYATHEVIPQRVLVVIAHPDDAEYMAGGTLAHWAGGGASIAYLVVTDGASGSRDPAQTPGRLADIRRDEQRAAAHILGADDITYLGYCDGRVEATLQLRLDIARVIRRVRPDVVLTFDPLFRYAATYINHPDHLAVANAALAAIMPIANTRLAAPELLDEDLEPHDVFEVYMMLPAAPNRWIALTEQELDLKLRALSAHASQLAYWDAERLAYAEAVQAAEVARAQGVACEFAEAFRWVQLVAPARLELSYAIPGYEMQPIGAGAWFRAQR